MKAFGAPNAHRTPARHDVFWARTSKLNSNAASGWCGGVQSVCQCLNQCNYRYLRVRLRSVAAEITTILSRPDANMCIDSAEETRP